MSYTHAMRILLYGFTNFGRYRTNVSEQVVKMIRRRPGLSKRVFKAEFEPAKFVAVAAKLKPDMVIGMGQCPKGDKLISETVAHNRYCRGRACSPIVLGGPKALKLSCRLPKDAAVVQGRDAGTFVCNYAMYLFEDWARRNGSCSAFLHIPRGYPVDQAVRHVESALDAMSRE